MTAVLGDGSVEGVSTKLTIFDVFTKLAVAVDDAQGMTHLVKDSGEQVVLAISFTYSGFISCASKGIIKFTAFPRGRVNEPANSISIVVYADSGGVGATVLVISSNCGFG